MFRFRIIILVLVGWFSLIFNLERPDLLGINLSSVVYFLVTAITVLYLLFPDLGSIRPEFMLIGAIGFYGLAPRLSIFTSSYSSPFMTVSEIAIIVLTIFAARLLSRSVGNVEQIIESLATDAGSTRILPMPEGEQVAKNELFRARRFNRPVSLIVLKTSDIRELRLTTLDHFNYQSVLQRRYLRNRIGQITESTLYHNEPIAWYADDLVICLPETPRDEAQNIAEEMGELVRLSLQVQVDMGVATFPEDGLIYDDLVQAAMRDVTTSGEHHDGARLAPTAEAPRTSVTAVADSKPLPFVHHLFDAFGQGSQILPPMQLVAATWTDQTPYYNPDFWVNQLPYQSLTARAIYLRLKRVADIALVLLSLPLTIPVGLLVAVAIMLTDGRPVLFVQQRTGLGGRKFRMYKFRTMVQDAEAKLREMNVRVNERGETINEHGEKLEDDPRITRIGAILRKTSLDELPQLWNVLMGDMSIVGPRPTSFGVDKYALLHTQRLSVKPGITGLWQIYDRGDTNFDNRLVWDIKYIDKQSMALDLQILVRTVLRVVKDRGAR